MEHTTLRHHRKNWALKQRHVAHLAAFKSRSSIAELEDGGAFAGLKAALALQFALGVSLIELFPAYAKEVENEVVSRALLIEEEVRDSADSSADRIREYLLHLISRAHNDTLV